MKRLLALILACSLILSCTLATVTASAEEVKTVLELQGTPAKVFRYNVGDDGVTITGYQGEAESIVIPDKIEGMPVTKIGDYAFCESNITSVKLPETLTSIGYRAFSDTALNEVTVPKSVKEIKDGAFGTYSTVLFYPENGTDCVVDYAYGDFVIYGYVGTAADDYFRKHAGISFIPLDCRDASAEYLRYTENDEGGITIIGFRLDELPDIVVIPDTINGKPVTEIADGAASDMIISDDGYFTDNRNNNYRDIDSYEDFGFKPRTVVLSENIQRVGSGAFGTLFAQTIYIPESLAKEIYYDPFVYTTEVYYTQPDDEGHIDGEASLRSFYYDFTEILTGKGSLSTWSNEIGANDGYTDDGFTFSLSEYGSIAITGYSGDDKDAFISHYIDGRTVTKIAKNAFEMSDIVSISLPHTISTIEDGAFYQCGNLESVYIRTNEEVQSSLKKIGYHAFTGCVSLKSVTIPNAIKEMDGCGLGVKDNHISSDWNYYDELQDELCADNGESYYKLAKSNYKETDGEPENEFIVLEKHLEKSFYLDVWVLYENSCFPMVIYGTRGTAAQSYAECFSLTFIPVDEDNIEKDYRDLKYEVDDHGFVVITGANEKADQALIPESIPSTDYRSDDREVIAVADNAFKDNKNLQKVSFDRFMYMSGRTQGVKTIGSYAFAGCDKLVEVDFTSGNVNPIIDKIGECAFLDCKSLKSVTLPMSVTSIGDHAFGYVTDGKNFSLDPDFVIYGYTGSAAEEYAKNNGIKFESIGYKGFDYNVIAADDESGLTGFAEITAYRGLDNYVDIPETLDNAPVRIIGEGAFAGNCVMDSVHIPKTVMYIKDKAFRGCEQLDSLYMSEAVNLVHIGNYAFAECSNIRRILIKENMKYIGLKAIGWSCYTISDYESSDVMQSENWYRVRINFANYEKHPDPHIRQGYGDCDNGLWDEIGYNMAADRYAQEHNNVEYCNMPELNGLSLSDRSTAQYEYHDPIDGVLTIDDVSLEQNNDDPIYCIPVTEIADGTFRNNLNDKINTVVIGNYINKIKTDTFTNYESVKEFYIPAGVEKIEDYAIGYSIYPMTATPDSPAHIHHKINGIVIYGYENTEAQRYANDNDITFYSLGNAAVDYRDTPDIPFTLGDVTADGKITAKDSLVIQRYTIGLESLELRYKLAADVNGDGKITAKDAIEILRFTIGLKSNYLHMYA